MYADVFFFFSYKEVQRVSRPAVQESVGPKVSAVAYFNATF